MLNCFVTKRAFALVAASCAAAMVVTSCGTSDEEPNATAALQGNESSAAPAPNPVDPATVSANELGLVPVLMYHRITAAPTSVYDRTPEDFRAELERLARENYVPVTTRDFATGNIDIPAGKHAVVLTFDDGTRSQLSLDKNGQPTPESAMGILLDVSKKNPGFRPVGSFYVNENPFEDGDGARTLRWLHEHDCEVGNHTVGHTNLRQADDATVARVIAEEQQLIQRAVPGITVSTIALPFGISPTNRALAMSGTSAGSTYQHNGVLLVGANPALSPFAANFAPGAIPRIRSQGAQGEGAELGSTTWLNRLAADPRSLYTSDGDPNKISFPANASDRLSPTYKDKATLY